MNIFTQTADTINELKVSVKNKSITLSEFGE